MKYIVSIGLLLCVLGLLFFCKVPNQTQKKLTPEEQYAMLFDIENKIELRLEMSEAEIAKMQQDYDAYQSIGSQSPIYRMADLHITITTPEGDIYTYSIEEVGVRMKGNTSRTDFYSPENGIYNLIHLKLSFQETFDDPAYYGTSAKSWSKDGKKLRKERTFATLEKLELRWNRCDDSTYLREYFAYETYRHYGIAAPHTNLASFQWAGTHMGVFTINEPVDEVFLQKQLPQSALGGDLYKVGWAGYHNGSLTSTGSIGIEDEDAGKFYAYDLQTNKKASNHEALKNLIKSINKNNISKETLAQLVDMDHFLTFSAVSYLLGNPDDMRNNYNNYYIYFRADNGKAIFIPYDFDRCLGITAHWNPTGDGVTSDNPFSMSLAATNEKQRNPLIIYSIAAGGYYVREYGAILENIASDSWFTYENFNNLYQIACGNYKVLTKPDKAFRNTEGLYLSFGINRTSPLSGNGNIGISTYLSLKLATLQAYLADINRYADAEPNSTPAWYIRADATNWQNSDAYAMEVEKDLVTIRITVSGQMRLKVYHDKTGKWYGAECVDAQCAVAYESDSDTNIVLNSGTYRIAFDPLSETIYLEKE